MAKMYLDAEDDLTGHIDESFDMPSITDCSCPACDEELHWIYEGRCALFCGCYCHDKE